MSPLILAALVAPAVAHASVVYDLTLTAIANSAYSGTGTITLNNAPAASGLTNYAAGQYSGLSFTIAGQTFAAPPGAVSAVQFLDGSVYDITFAQQIGTSPTRFALATTANYAFYYDNLQSAAYGMISSAPAAQPVPTPEPSAFVVVATALAGLGLIGLRRRMR